MILIVSLSPAWQRTLEFPRLTLGGVNRARRVVESASGKGVNVARVANQLGAKAKLLTTLGGERGALLARSLKAQGIPERIVRCQSETRICQTLLGSDSATELVEETPPLTRREVAAVFRAFDEELRRARILTLIGTAPRGMADNFYAQLISRASRRNIPTLIDAQGELLLSAVRQKPLLVRINRAELAAAVGRSSKLSNAQTFTASNQLLKLGAQWVVVTDGANEVLVISSEGRWSTKPPKIRAVNPIGSGDSMLAGIARELHRGQAVFDAIRFGVACGAANALTTTAGDVLPSAVTRLARRIKIQKV